jgi:hypothetical protein
VSGQQLETEKTSSLEKGGAPSLLNAALSPPLPCYAVSTWALWIFAGIFLVNLPWLYEACERAGDYSLILLQTERAKHFDALEGPYSRFHFRHPAPTFFYFYALVSPLFFWVPSPQGVLYAAQCLLNGLFLWGSLRILSRESRSSSGPLSLLLAALWVALSLDKHFLFDPWGPSSVVFPFLAALVGFAALARGNFSGLLLLTAGMLFSVSNHLSTAPILAALLLIAAANAYLHCRKSRGYSLKAGDRTQLALSSLLLIAALIPVAIEASTSPGGSNLRSIAKFLTNPRTEPLRGLFETSEYVSSYLSAPFGDWHGSASILIGVLLVSLALLASKRAAPPARHLFCFSLGTLALIFAASLHVPGKMHTYLFLYASAPTIVFLSIIISKLSSRFEASAHVQGGILFALSAVTLIVVYQAPKECGGKYEGLLNSLSLSKSTPIQISPPSAQAWIPFATLTSLMYRKGYLPCVGREWEFMFTPALVCTSTPSRVITLGTKRDMGRYTEENPIFSGDLAAISRSE